MTDSSFYLTEYSIEYEYSKNTTLIIKYFVDSSGELDSLSVFVGKTIDALVDVTDLYEDLTQIKKDIILEFIYENIEKNL